MKPRYFLLLPALALCQTAIAADSSSVSPYDANPACMERGASASNCVIQSEGTPRHTYPPSGRVSAQGSTVMNTGSLGGTGVRVPAATPSVHYERGRGGSR